MSCRPMGSFGSEENPARQANPTASDNGEIVKMTVNTSEVDPPLSHQS